MSFFKSLWHPKKEEEDVPPTFLSPIDLWRHSFLAGAAFSIGGCVVILDGICIVLLSYGYGYARTWAKDSMLLVTLPKSPLPGIVASILATCLWYGMQLCLTIDILLALSTTSRELQEGSVYSYGIVTMWQIPLMFICLGFQLSPANRDWVKEACTLTSLSPSCDDWWTSVKASAIAPTIIALLLHLVFFLVALIFCRTRSAKSLRPPKVKESRAKNKASNPLAPQPHPVSPTSTTFPPYRPASSDSEGEQLPSAPSRTMVGGNPPWLLKETALNAPLPSRKPSNTTTTQLELGNAEEGRSSRSSRRRGASRSGAEASDDAPLLSESEEEAARSRSRSSRRR